MPSWVPAGLAPALVRSNYEGKLASWFNQGGNAYFIKRPLLARLFPTPNEGELLYEACGLRWDFDNSANIPDKVSQRLRTRFSRIFARSSGKVFLTKRTANNRRIELLREIFPEARFIHLVRDGRDVAQSLSQVEWWDQHTVWWDGRTPVEMEQAGNDRLQICARNWVEEMQALGSSLAKVPQDKQMVLRFEQLMESPVGTLESILQFLDIPPTEDYRAAIQSLGIATSKPKWQKNWDNQQLDSVQDVQRECLRSWGYAELEAL